MSKEMKYVIVGDIQPILFSTMNKHSDFRCVGNITSAGFCHITYDKLTHTFIVSVYGDSVSLVLRSKPEDATSIERMLNDY